MDLFTKAYIECALWSSVDDEGEPLDEFHGIDDLAPDTLKQMVEDCAAFQAEHYALIHDDLERAGCDFWLTRNRHGAGFWDGDWPKPDSTTLTDDSHAYGGVDLYVGDDGLIYSN